MPITLIVPIETHLLFRIPVQQQRCLERERMPAAGEGFRAAQGWMGDGSLKLPLPDVATGVPKAKRASMGTIDPEKFSRKTKKVSPSDLSKTYPRCWRRDLSTSGS